MSLVPPADLAAFMGTAESVQMQTALDIAEIQVGNFLGMREGDGLGLARRDVIKTFYPARAAHAIETPTGPIERIGSVEIGGVAQTAGLIVLLDPWTIQYDPATTFAFSQGQRIELACTIGYVASFTPEDPPPDPPELVPVILPENVRLMVLIQASGVVSNLGALATGSVKESERFGDWSVSYATTAGSSSEGVVVISPVLSLLAQGLRRAPYTGA